MLIAAYDRSIQPDEAHFYQGTVKLDSGPTVQLRGNPENWYDYEFTRTDGRTIQSYWRQPQGIDAGEASVGKYAVQLLVGHHGIVSLTPIWLLAIPGFGLLFWDKNYRLRGLAIAALLVTIVCILFYIFRPAIERNYGGSTSGFRWVFWLTPLWLLVVLPTADKLSSCARAEFWAAWYWRFPLSQLLTPCGTLSAILGCGISGSTWDGEGEGGWWSGVWWSGGLNTGGLVR